MRKRSIEFDFTGMFIGLVLGAILGYAALRMVKKSQIGAAAPYIIGFSTVFCAFIGFNIGQGVGKNDYINEKLGLKKILQDGYLKDGRYWIGITKWIDGRNQAEHILVTARSNQKFLISQLNDRVILKHDDTSASKTAIPKCHEMAKNYVFGILRNTYADEPKELATIFPTVYSLKGFSIF